MFCTKKSQIKIVIFNPGNHFKRSVGYAARRLVLVSNNSEKEAGEELDRGKSEVGVDWKKMFLMCTGRVADISFLYTPECTSVCHGLCESSRVAEQVFK